MFDCVRQCHASTKSLWSAPYSRHNSSGVFDTGSANIKDISVFLADGKLSWPAERKARITRRTHQDPRTLHTKRAAPLPDAAPVNRAHCNRTAARRQSPETDHMIHHEGTKTQR